MSLKITRHDASFRVESYNRNNNRQITIDLGDGDTVTLYGLPYAVFNSLLYRFDDAETINYGRDECEDEPALTAEDHAERGADMWIKARKEERAFS